MQDTTATATTECHYWWLASPVVASDAGRTCAGGHLALFVVAGVHMSLLSLPLQDLAKVVGADAPEEGGHLMRLLNHPLYPK